MNRKERRKGISPYRIQTPFEHMKGKDDTPQVRYIDNTDGRRTAIITLKGYASTKVKDADGDVIDPSIIDLTRFREGNLPLKAQHGRGIPTNIGIISSLVPDEYGLYMEAETRLDVSKDAHGRPLNQDDYVVYDRLMNKAVTGFSIGFHNVTWEYNETDDEYKMVALTLHEVSVVDVSSNAMTAIRFYQKAYEALLQSLSTMKKGKKTITISNDLETKEVEETTEEDVTEEVAEEEENTEEKSDKEESEKVEEETNEEDQEQNEEGKTISTKQEKTMEDGEEKAVDGEVHDDPSINEMLKEAVLSKLGIDVTVSKERVWIADIYVGKFVYNHYSWDEVSGFDKYLRASYSISSDGTVSVGDDTKEVESRRVRIEKKAQLGLTKDVATTQEGGGDATTDEETSENEEKSLSEESMRDTIVKSVEIIKGLQTELEKERELRAKAEKRVQKLEGLKVKTGILNTTPKEEKGEVAKAFKNAGITF